MRLHDSRRTIPIPIRTTEHSWNCLRSSSNITKRSVFSSPQPDPVEAILFRMEQQGLREKDIADVLGGKNRASEVLARAKDR